MRPPRQRTVSGSSISSVISLESTASFRQEDHKQPSLHDLIELFLCCLLVLNYLRDDKLDADARVAAFKCITGGDQASENDLGRKRESTMEFLCKPVICPMANNTLLLLVHREMFTHGEDHKKEGTMYRPEFCQIWSHGDLIEEEGKSIPFQVKILHMHRLVFLE